MKRILILIFTMIIFPLFCLGATPAKWYTMPVNVYIPEHSKAPLMKKAFLDLQNSTGYIKFRFLNEQGARRAHIKVSFVSKCNYENAVGLTYMEEKRNAFKENTVKIGLRDIYTNKPYSNETLYIIMLHEAGHAIGMKHSPNPSDIMYYTLNPRQKKLTKNDIQQIIYLYK